MPTAGFPLPHAGSRHRPLGRRTHVALFALLTIPLSLFAASAAVLAQIPAPSASPARNTTIATPTVAPPLPAAMPDQAAKGFSPRPATENPSEIAYRKFADDIIAPILKHQISDDDLKRLKSAFQPEPQGQQ